MGCLPPFDKGGLFPLWVVYKGASSIPSFVSLKYHAGICQPAQASLGSKFVELKRGSVATLDTPYFNLRLTSLEVEAETRGAKTRAVGGCSVGGPRALTGGAGFPCTRECPQPPTRAGIL